MLSWLSRTSRVVIVLMGPSPFVGDLIASRVKRDTLACARTGLALPTEGAPKLTKGGGRAMEVGLMLYRDCQAAMVHGITDLFAIASVFSRDRGGPAVSRASSPLHH